MSSLIKEVKEWNTPLVTGYLLWRFTQGFYENQKNGEAPVALNHFIAMPILLNSLLLEKINNRRKSLQSYIKSFEEEKRSDLLAGIHDLVRKNMLHTLQSLDVAVTSGLLVWNYESAVLYPTKIQTKIKRGHSLRKDIVNTGDKAEILGKWFSEHDVLTVASYLKVVL